MKEPIVAIRIVKTTEPPQPDQYCVQAYRRFPGGGTERYPASDFTTEDQAEAKAVARLLLRKAATFPISLWTYHSR